MTALTVPGDQKWRLSGEEHVRFVVKQLGCDHQEVVFDDSADNQEVSPSISQHKVRSGNKRLRVNLRINKGTVLVEEKGKLTRWNRWNTAHIIAANELNRAQNITIGIPRSRTALWLRWNDTQHKMHKNKRLNKERFSRANTAALQPTKLESKCVDQQSVSWMDSHTVAASFEISPGFRWSRISKASETNREIKSSNPWKISSLCQDLGSDHPKFHFSPRPQPPFNVRPKEVKHI